MTPAERMRRYRKRLDPKVTALKRRFDDLTAIEKAAFREWIKRQK